MEETKGLFTLNSVEELLDLIFADEEEFKLQVKAAMDEENDKEIEMLFLARMRNAKKMQEVIWLKDIYKACINRKRFKKCVVANIKVISREVVNRVFDDIEKEISDQINKEEGEDDDKE